mgnify:CR=1 FL=1
MMSRVWCVVSVLALVMVTTGTASAQSHEGLSLGVFGGVSAVEHAGPVGGIELASARSARVHVFGEAAWFGDVVTRRRVETVEAVAAHLAARQGQAATGTIDAPATSFTVGARFLLAESSALRPYVAVQAGIARVTLQPTFELGGTDVTEKLEQYGVTLGEDVTGSAVRPAFGGGLGVLLDRDAWTVDASVRVLRIQTSGQATTVTRLSVGIGRRF